MSKQSEFERDVVDFVLTLGKSVEATPNENQYVISHIVKQIELGAKKKPDEYIEADKGYEPVFVFEKGGLDIKKRVFHPRDARGVDFVMTKYVSGKSLGVTAIQVKRNRGKAFFEFTKRDLTQLRKFLNYWGSGYYLLVDETSQSPTYCFVTTAELFKVILNVSKDPRILIAPKRVAIPNQDVMGYCRGLNLFYNLFYSCSRGQKMPKKDFATRVSEYAKKALRTVVEILITRFRSLETGS